MESARVVKEEGKENDLLSRIEQHPAFETVKDSLHDLMDPSLFIGRAEQQVGEFMEDCIQPLLEKYCDLLEEENKDQVKV